MASQPAQARQPAQGDDEPTSAQPDGDPGQAPAAQPEPEPAKNEIDVDELRRQYLQLRDRLFRARARAAAVASAIYSSRISIKLDYESGRFYTVTRATIRLDGANVFDDSNGAIAQDKATRFEGYIAPGRHVVSIRIEAAGKDDSRFVSTSEQSFVVQAVAGSDLVVRANAKDDGDIAFAWKKKSKGSYKLRLDVSVKTEKRQGKSERIKRASR